MDALMDLNQVWQKTWDGLGRVAPAGALDALTARYNEASRRYHTLQHLAECFEQFDRLQPDFIEPAAVMLAIWYHDAVYTTTASDNEAQSAALAEAVLREANAPASIISTVNDLIMVTQHSGQTASGDQAFFLDIDLSILGAPPTRFNEYEQAIRFEYAWVEQSLYQQGRSKVLRHFLERKRIYHSEAFFAEYEAQARSNLTGALAALS